jgi:hypothetical protein
MIFGKVFVMEELDTWKEIGCSEDVAASPRRQAKTIQTVAFFDSVRTAQWALLKIRES